VRRTANRSAPRAVPASPIVNKNTRQIQIFIGAMVLAAAGGASYAGMASHTLHLLNALAVLVLAAATSRMKVRLPGVDGTMSVNLPFLLMAVVSLSAVEALVIASISTVVQCWPKRDGRFRPEQLLFNGSMWQSQPAWRV
jgi:hypothetical protein